LKGVTRSLLLVLCLPSALRGQGVLSQFSYEGLRFSGLGVELGVVTSDRVTTEVVGGVRVDYGRIAPRVRLIFGASYFKGELDADEVTRFEEQLSGIVIDPTNDFVVDVGSISWANFEGDLDLQYVLSEGTTLTFYAGVGFGVHFRNGSGQSIDGTFVEDALDTIAAGFNLSAGSEVRLTRYLNFYTDLRVAVSSELNTASLRGGFMYRPGTISGER